jgi:DNA-binding protein YbaB
MELENRRFREQKGSGLEICNKEKRQLQKKLDTAQAELKNMKSRGKVLFCVLHI